MRTWPARDALLASEIALRWQMEAVTAASNCVADFSKTRWDDPA
jgi:hypothetical protein